MTTFHRRPNQTQTQSDNNNNNNATMHAGTQGGGHPLEPLPCTYLHARKIPG